MASVFRNRRMVVILGVSAAVLVAVIAVIILVITGERKRSRNRTGGLSQLLRGKGNEGLRGDFYPNPDDRHSNVHPRIDNGRSRRTSMEG